MHPHHIKICGLTTEEAVRVCANYKIGFNGFIAYPPSPRHLNIETMAQLRSHVSPASKAVLVTVDMNKTELDDYITTVKPDMLQLHGNESPQHCAALKQQYGIPIIKALGISDAHDLDSVDNYHTHADMLLLDTKRADGSSGGTGKVFDWSLLEGKEIDTPFFLSGGIGIDNIAQAAASGLTPYMDVSSALEGQKGIKDPEKIRDFMKIIESL